MYICIAIVKAGDCLNTLAWNNGIGPRPILLASRTKVMIKRVV